MSNTNSKKTEDQTDNRPAQTYDAAGYKPMQAQVETDYAGWLDTVNKEQQSNAANPERHAAYANEEMNRKYAEAGIDPAGQGVNPSRSFYSDDPNYQSAVSRDAAQGTSGGDEYWLSDAELAYVQHCKQMYANATTQEDKNYWHGEAEKVRARYDYSGGTDGSMFLSTMQSGSTGDSGSSGEGVSGTGSGGGTPSDLKSYLDAWQQAALQQSGGQIDYAVQQAVTELQRALADAETQYKEQAESVDRDARQAMDNSALYAELRGDKGGIGREQYSSIQNTRAQNHLAVQQAQTKLATDTERQIADLRAQGEFEKADAALELTQNYLSQLVSLEQWAAEYDLSAAQFEASLQQWEAEYNMAMQQLQISQNQWQQEFDYTKQLNSTNQLSGMGEALLGAGIMPSNEQLTAMGMTQAQAQEYITAMQMTAQLEASKGDKKTVSIADVDLSSAYDYLYANGLNSGSKADSIAAMLATQGIPSDVAKQVAALYKEIGYAQAEKKYIDSNPLAAPAPSAGMNPDYFRAEMTSIMQSLGQGHLDTIESTVNRIWPSLSEEQRKQLQDALGKYGIALS